MEEYEVKFLAIDPIEIERRLAAIGAHKAGEFFYKRRVFDYPDLRLNGQGAWVRVRDEGDFVKLNFKQRLGMTSHDGSSSDAGMEETEVTVSDFDATCRLLEKIGLTEKFYAENRRIRWMKDRIEFDIDTWPRLKPYLEIEAPTWEDVDRAIHLLGLDPAQKKIFSTHQVYRLNGINENEYQRITFDGLVKKKEDQATSL